MSETSYYQSFLRKEFERRAGRNSRYSLRAFAQALGLSSGSLSEIMNGKRLPSKTVAARLMDGLRLTPKQRASFMASVAKRSGSSPAKGKEIDLEVFKVISDWYHYAIVLLSRTEGFQSRSDWIARQLGITRGQAASALTRLLSVGLLKSDGARVLPWDGKFSTTANKDITSAALREHQRQILEKAITSLEKDSLELRSMTSMTFAIDPSKIPEAKSMIEDFTHRLSELFDTGRELQVYQLGVCLYPLQPSEDQESV